MLSCELCVYDPSQPPHKFKFQREYIQHMKDVHKISISPTDGRAWKPDDSPDPPVT